MQYNTILWSDAVDYLKLLPDACVDSIVTDPPYPEIKRAYGTLSEIDWMTLMAKCVFEFRRVLKPTGSAAIILQPNSSSVGSMRLWLWRFMVFCGEYWNIVQDAYWWNFAQMPTVHSQRDNGLMRPSVKTVVWLGNPDCYRNQDAVLWSVSDATRAQEEAFRLYRPRRTRNLNGNGTRRLNPV